MRCSVFGFGAAFAFTLALYSMPAVAAPAATAAAPTASAVVKAYADAGHGLFRKAAETAGTLRSRVDVFLSRPSTQTLARAREAWVAAHSAYSATESLRFGNPVVDEWESRVNAWPLDEGLIDYVAPSYGKTSDENPLYTLNVVANTRIRIGAKQIDATRIDKALLRQLQEAEGVEANVATGYHAIEFLLWGQDLHGTGPGAGERPYTDYDLKNCTHGHCDRRAAYLRAAAALLADDLAEMMAAWGPNGKARKDLLAKQPEEGLAAILTGLGSLSYGELAGERMRLGLMLHDPEEEQDCFSDQTHFAHYYNQFGMMVLWDGIGLVAPGPSLRLYAMARAPQAARRLDEAMKRTRARLNAIVETAQSGRMAYDQMIGPNNPTGNKMVQDAIDALVAQTRAIEGVVAALHLNVRLKDSENFTNAGQR
jgi:putative iron-regulated protein